ncbi:MAG: hypothetical protein Q4G08_03425 [Capnocytophaga sp.]|nr:hypothetical protein [Capnocytophaga sp.]
MLRFALLFFTITVFSQEKYYEFPVFDGSRMMTMWQSNELVQNASRLLANTVIVSERDAEIYSWVSLAATTLLLMPVTHEEGHRSVLTFNDIGSVSQPILDKNLVAKVTGGE